MPAISNWRSSVTWRCGGEPLSAAAGKPLNAGPSAPGQGVAGAGAGGAPEPVRWTCSSHGR